MTALWAVSSISTSYSNIATTASYFSGSISSASYAITASYAISSSYLTDTASNSIFSQTTITSDFSLDGMFCLTSSYAKTASYATSFQYSSSISTLNISNPSTGSSYFLTDGNTLNLLNIYNGVRWVTCSLG